MTRPTDDLEWALLDDVDPTSGQNNVVEPPAAWKNYGWTYQEKPPRNYDNWFKRTSALWIAYLDASLFRAATVSVAASDATDEAKNHADYVCDGTNDEVQISAAIAAAASTGGTVLLSEGTFSILDAIALGTNVHLRGMGKGATIIQVDDATTASFNMLAGTSKSRLSVSDLTLDGNGASHSYYNNGIVPTTSSLINVLRCSFIGMSADSGGPPSTYGHGVLADESTQVVVLGCDFEVEGFGVLIDGDSHSAMIGFSYFASCGLSAAGGGVRIDGDNNVLANCQLRANDVDGIVVTGDYNLVAACHSRDNGGWGIHLNAGSYNEVVSCHANGNGYDGIRLSSCTGNNVHGNFIGDNGYNGIALVSSDVNRIAENVIWANGQNTDNTYDGIELDSNSEVENWVVSNVVRRGGGANQQKYGFSCPAGSTNRVFGNDFATGGSTASIDPSAGATFPHDGKYLADDGSGTTFSAITISNVNMV